MDPNTHAKWVPYQHYKLSEVNTLQGYLKQPGFLKLEVHNFQHSGAV